MHFTSCPTPWLNLPQYSPTTHHPPLVSVQSQLLPDWASGNTCPFSSVAPQRASLGMLLPEAPLCALLPGVSCSIWTLPQAFSLPCLFLTIFPAKLTSTKGSTKFFLLLSKPKICLTLSITASSTGEGTCLSLFANVPSAPDYPPKIHTGHCLPAVSCPESAALCHTHL